MRFLDPDYHRRSEDDLDIIVVRLISLMAHAKAILFGVGVHFRVEDVVARVHDG